MIMTLQKTYTPTFLEKVLGRRYKWWFIVTYYFKQQTHYRSNSAFYSIDFFLSQFLIIFIWFLNSGEGRLVETSFILSYLWFGNLYRALTITWIENDMSADIKEGKISKYLLYPTDYFWSSLFQFFGKGVLANGFILSVPSFFILFLFHQHIHFPHFSNLIFLSFFLFITFFIKHCIAFLIGSIVFWSTEYGGILKLWDGVYTFFSGIAIPLYLLHKATFYNPLAFTFYHPSMIFGDQYTSNQILLVFLGGILWCFVLYFLAKWVFKMGLKRNESVGL